MGKPAFSRDLRATISTVLMDWDRLRKQLHIPKRT